MENTGEKPRIKIVKNGPYIVTGNAKLAEKLIEPKGKGYIYKEGRKFSVASSYALCRCGKSKNPPFCDNAHVRGFYGAETAAYGN